MSQRFVVQSILLVLAGSLASCQSATLVEPPGARSQAQVLIIPQGAEDPTPGAVIDGDLPPDAPGTTESRFELDCGRSRDVSREVRTSGYGGSESEARRVCLGKLRERANRVVVCEDDICRACGDDRRRCEPNVTIRDVEYDCRRVEPAGAGTPNTGGQWRCGCETERLWLMCTGCGMRGSD